MGAGTIVTVNNQLFISFVDNSSGIVFAKGRCTTLLRSMNNGAADVDDDRSNVGTQIVRCQHAYFFIALLPYHLADRRTGFAMDLASQGAGRTRLLGAVREHPNVGMFNIVARKFAHFLTSLTDRAAPIGILASMFHSMTYQYSFTQIGRLELGT